MRFEAALVLVVVVASSGCVVSSGTGDPPPAGQENQLQVDGADRDVDSVVVEVTADGAPWADHRLFRVGGRAGDFTLRFSFDSFDAGDRALSAFGENIAVVTDGIEAEIVSQAVSGTVRIVSGDGTVGEDVVVEAEDVVVVDACTGAETVIDHARFTGAAAVSDLLDDDDDIGLTGFIDGDLDAGAAHNDGAAGDHVIGIVAGIASTFTDGTPSFRTETTDSCAARANPLNLIVVLEPSELPAPGTTVRFSSLAKTVAFLAVLERPATIVARAILQRGDITVSEPVTLDDGGVFDAVLDNAEFDYVDADGNDTDDPPATSTRLHIRALLGKPEL